MALVKCRECSREVSDQAETCPHCGIRSPGQPNGPIGQTPKPSPTPPKTKGNGCLTFILIFFVIIIVIGVISAIGSNSSPSSNQNSSPQSPSDSGNSGAQSSSSPAATCSSDWHACKDNADLVNNSQKWIAIQSACEDKVDSEVQYGEPKWPGFLSGGGFASFHPGTDYISTGIAVAIEPDVQIENAFGAMVHSTAICRYDLNAQSVVDVSWSPN